MASDPLDILSVAGFKTAARVFGDDTDMDALIAIYIRGAAEWSEKLCALGIIDTETSAIVPAPLGDCRLVVRHRAPVILDFRWRGAGDCNGDFVAGVATPGRLGDGHSTVAAPAGGWPGGHLEIVYVRSMPADEVPGAIRSAMTLWARDAFDLVSPTYSWWPEFIG